MTDEFHLLAIGERQETEGVVAMPLLLMLVDFIASIFG